MRRTARRVHRRRARGRSAGDVDVTHHVRHRPARLPPERRHPRVRPGGQIQRTSALAPRCARSGTSPATSAHGQARRGRSTRLRTGWSTSSPARLGRRSSSRSRSRPAPRSPVRPRASPSRAAARSTWSPHAVMSSPSSPGSWSAHTSTRCRRRRAPRTTRPASRPAGGRRGGHREEYPAARRPRRLRGRGAPRVLRRRPPLRLHGVRRRADPGRAALAPRHGRDGPGGVGSVMPVGSVEEGDPLRAEVWGRGPAGIPTAHRVRPEVERPLVVRAGGPARDPARQHVVRRLPLTRRRGRRRGAGSGRPRRADRRGLVALAPRQQGGSRRAEPPTPTGRPSAPMRAGSQDASVTVARPVGAAGGRTWSVSTPVSEGRYQA